MNHANMRFSAGAGQADVTPAMGIQIAGDIARYRPTEEIRDRLWARALVLEDADRRACIVAADVISMTERYADELRRWIAEFLETDREAVMIHCSQTHSAPSVGNCMLDDDYSLPADLWWLRGGDDRYVEPFFCGVKAAVKEARESLCPVTLKAVRGIDGRVAFTRRYILRDGTHKSQPPRCYSEILRPEGHADPEVSVAVLVDQADKTIAALLHHTCHPAHGYPHRWISADWPGYWSQAVRQHFGGSCVALVLNGFCGNILHGNPLDPDFRSNIYLMGERLMETTRRILPDLKTFADLPLKWVSRTLKIPMRKLSDDDIEKARRLLREHPEPMWKDEAKTNIQWDWFYAMSRRELAERQKTQSTVDYEVQALRIGDLAVVGCPGEPFVEAQLDIKMGSPANQTLVAHMCNGGRGGYVPTRQAFAMGGYETWVSNGCCLDEGALEQLTAAAREILRDLFK